MACSPGPPPPLLLFDTLSSTPAITWTGPGIDFVLGGAGTRDFDTNTTPAEIKLTLPAGAIIQQAILYANILVEHPFAFPSLDFKVNGGGYTFPATTLIGWCNDTCWLANGNGTGNDGATTPQDIYNRVYTTDVTADVIAGFVVGLNTFFVRLPGVVTAVGPDSVAVLGSDAAHYPTCNGSQGVVLLII